MFQENSLSMLAKNIFMKFMCKIKVICPSSACSCHACYGGVLWVVWRQSAIGHTALPCLITLSWVLMPWGYLILDQVIILCNGTWHSAEAADALRMLWQGIPLWSTNDLVSKVSARTGRCRAHCTNIFSIVIQIWWKFRFVLIQIIMKW